MGSNVTTSDPPARHSVAAELPPGRALRFGVSAPLELS